MKRTMDRLLACVGLQRIPKPRHHVGIDGMVVVIPDVQALRRTMDARQHQQASAALRHG